MDWTELYRLAYGRMPGWMMCMCPSESKYGFPRHTFGGEIDLAYDSGMQQSVLAVVGTRATPDMLKLTPDGIGQQEFNQWFTRLIAESPYVLLACMSLGATLEGMSVGRTVPKHQLQVVLDSLKDVLAKLVKPMIEMRGPMDSTPHEDK